MYMLSEYPNIAKRLREEVMELVGAERPPNYQELYSLKYLRAFLNGKRIGVLILRIGTHVPLETLRLFPVL